MTIILRLSFLCRTRRFGDFAFVVSFGHLHIMMQHQSINIEVMKMKWVLIQSFIHLPYFWGQNGCSKRGTGLAWGTSVRLSCFNAFSSSTCKTLGCQFQVCFQFESCNNIYEKACIPSLLLHSLLYISYISSLSP